MKGIKWQKSGHNNRLFAVKYKNDEKDIVISGGWDMNVIIIFYIYMIRLMYGIEGVVKLYRQSMDLKYQVMLLISRIILFLLHQIVVLNNFNFGIGEQLIFFIHTNGHNKNKIIIHFYSVHNLINIINNKLLHVVGWK